MPTFTWYPQTAQQTIQPRVLSAKFGDGYEQRTADGINSKPSSWALTFTAAKADADAIRAFLEARGGVESFAWTTPDGSAGTFICREWSSEILTTNARRVSATFEEVFGS